MQKTFQYPRFPYVKSEAQRTGSIRRHPIVIVGAGPVGLTAALDCARRGLPVVLLDDNDTVSVGSRGVCYAKRPLEIFDRLGVAEALLARGVSWNLGKVFFRDRMVHQFDLLPEAGHRMPAMINLQQYHLEQTLVAACVRESTVALRWKHRVVGLQQHADHVALAVETPDGIFNMHADWLLACDGANSDVRRMVGASFTGQAFQDRFLIADVVMKAPFPTQRWFWFDPPFHPGQSVLLHRQADDVWRIDFQLGWDADPELEKRPENVLPRIRAMLGPERPFELEWISIYQFACRRIDRLRHHRVLFAGDAAHQVSPFGARGGNTGIQDVDNLIWKLTCVINGIAPDRLLDSYHDERSVAADDNLGHSTRSTDFITPKNGASRRFRDAVLELAEDAPFARRLINSGRLSTPTPYLASPLNTPDPHDAAFAAGVPCGTVVPDAPVKTNGTRGWLLPALGNDFVVLVFDQVPPMHVVSAGVIDARVLTVGHDLIDDQGLLASRFDARAGTVYLIRPDQHVAARWRQFDAVAIGNAIRRAMALNDQAA